MNADRQANILDALNRLGASTPAALAAWLGHPYCFDSNIAALVAAGAIVEQVEHCRMGIIRRLAIA